MLTLAFLEDLIDVLDKIVREVRLVSEANQAWMLQLDKKTKVFDSLYHAPHNLALFHLLEEVLFAAPCFEAHLNPDKAMSDELFVVDWAMFDKGTYFLKPTISLNEMLSFCCMEWACSACKWQYPCPWQLLSLLTLWHSLIMAKMSMSFRMQDA